jgi:hypothetical protein
MVTKMELMNQKIDVVSQILQVYRDKGYDVSVQDFSSYTLSELQEQLAIARQQPLVGIFNGK